MEKIITLLASNSFVKILLIAVALDTILGVLRAIKEHKFNSCVGIDGAIRKAAMLFSVCLLMAMDVIVHINVLCMIPEQYIQVLGISKLGVCEFFSLLFILYELVSILKNMTLCGLPVPTKIKIWMVHYRVSVQNNKNFYADQVDTLKASGMDGFAGDKYRFIDKFQAWIE